MSFSRSTFYSMALLVLVLSASACSSSPPAGEGNADGALPAPESTADQVGSIPEDMLADEKGVEGSKDSADAAPSEMASSAPAEDPFGDLKEKDSSADRDALLVPEDEKPSHNAAGSGQMDNYVVKTGDTLMKIAFNIYGDVDRWKELQELNSKALKGKLALRKGMKIRYEVPAEAFSPDQHAKTYEIKKGDTLAGIADEVYGKKMKYKKLQGYNKSLIKNPNRIFAGFTIYYDITEKEIAEAEARKAQRAAGGGGSPPSAVSPPSVTQPAPKNVATDNSAVQGPTSGPPAPASN
jgi:LysM repeat protein